jgi:hypothetical protein
MKKYAIKQLSVFIENKKGTLNEATSILFEESITVKSLLLLDSTDFGILRLIVDDPTRAKEILADAGYAVRINDVFAVKVEDEIGKFHKVANILCENEINILYTYAFRDKETGVFVFKVDRDDFEKATKALKENDMEVVDADFFD